MTKSINKEVEVNTFAFTNKKDFSSIPKVITVDNHRYSFVDNGLRYLVKQGQNFIRLLDMTDGQSTFRLRNDGNDWTLISIKTA